MSSAVASSPPPPNPTDNEPVFPCANCGRNFIRSSLNKHEPACKKLTKMRRRVFDSGFQRVKGTDIPLQDVRKAQQEKHMYGGVFPRPQTHWRERHEEFINAVSASKDVRHALKTGAPLPPPPRTSVPSNYVHCDFCGRSFNQRSAERHIAFCQEQHTRKTGASSSSGHGSGSTTMTRSSSTSRTSTASSKSTQRSGGGASATSRRNSGDVKAASLKNGSDKRTPISAQSSKPPSATSSIGGGGVGGRSSSTSSKPPSARQRSSSRPPPAQPLPSGIFIGGALADASAFGQKESGSIRRPTPQPVIVHNGIVRSTSRDRDSLNRRSSSTSRNPQTTRSGSQSRLKTPKPVVSGASAGGRRKR